MYNPATSHAKAFRVSVPPTAALVVVWLVREFLHREIPADVALAILGGVAYGAEWLRNRMKHGWKRV